MFSGVVYVRVQSCIQIKEATIGMREWVELVDVFTCTCTLNVIYEWVCRLILIRSGSECFIVYT